jgi:D-alanyl-D-alanine carboxypeptidase
MPNLLSRRNFIGAGTSVAATSLLLFNSFSTQEGLVTEGSKLPWLDSFAADYMRTMHAPGMIVACVDGSQVDCQAYGYSNLESKRPVTLNQPFCIGSITKSFVALIAMQLRDEGKLDLQKPILEILPSLPIHNDFGPITPHHLLTHTSGLPNWLQLVSTDPNEKASQAYKPGERYSYCNLGFDTLGLLIAHLDGRPWPDAVQARILTPLDMSGASGRINAVTQLRLPTGYQFLFRDRPDTLPYALIPSAELTMDNPAGSISATAADMAKYIRMLASGGVGPHGRLLSAESFTLLSTPNFKAPDLSPTASYGYGIGIDTIDGHKVLRHTGGMTDFASSIVVDLDAGLGAFASINSMQGYRPNPITLFAVKVLNARKASLPLPAAPVIEDPLNIEDPAQYAGTYTAPDGEVLTITASGKQLSVTSSRGTTLLYPAGSDAFTAVDSSAIGTVTAIGNPTAVPGEFAVSFGRLRRSGPNAEKSPVVDLSIGPRWYAGERYQGPRTFAPLSDGAKFVGKYSNDSPWTTMVHVIERNGKLWLDGTAELHPDGDNRFSVGGGEGTLHLEFFTFIDGRAHLLRMHGEGFRRVEV